MRTKFLASFIAILAAALLTTLALAAPPGGAAPAPSQADSGDARRVSHTVPIVNDRETVTRPPQNVRPQAPAAAATGSAPAVEEKTRLRDADSRALGQDGSSTRGSKNVLTTLGSLAIVLGLFGAVALALRRSMPKASQRLPSEVVEVLGQTPLGHRQQAQLIRLGKKLLLLSVAPTGTETLAEVTDAAEVDRLLSLCRDPSGGATPSFRDVLQQFRGRPAPTPTSAALPGMTAAGQGGGERGDV
jgi:flagellar biogenesis protein FliO